MLPTSVFYGEYDIPKQILNQCLSCVMLCAMPIFKVMKILCEYDALHS